MTKKKKDWHEWLPEALWAYRTTCRTPAQATPYSLVFGREEVLPLEVQIPSLRVAIQESLTEEESAIIRLAELETLDERRFQVQQNLEIYQQRMAFNKRVRLRSFKKGDLVLMVRTPIIINRRTGGKLEPKWEGPYVIEKVYSNGAYLLITMDDEQIIPPTKTRFLKNKRLPFQKNAP